MSLRIGRDELRRAAERYRLVGVHCASCKRVIESEVSRVPGVRRVEVDPASGVMVLELEPGADRRLVLEAVRRAGYDMFLERLLLRVPGLREGMGSRITRELSSLPGVVEVSVFESGRLVRVEYDPDSVSPNRIIEVLRGLGLEASPVEQASEEERLGPELPLAGAAVLVYAVGALMGSTLVQAVGGLLGLIAALRAFILPAVRVGLRGHMTMDTLLSLGVASAAALSLYGLLTGGPVYFDAVVLITFFVLAGRSVEARLRRRAEKLLENARSLLPDKARVLRDGRAVVVPEGEVRPGDIVVVAAGERVPVDGRVAGGRGELDESPLTGESRPRPVGPGELVLAGSLLLRGRLEVEALRTGRYRLAARALDAAREAGLYKPRLQRIADRAVAVFVPAVLTAAAATFLGHLALGAGLTTALLRAATVLVVACPCALGIAVPAAVAAGVARAYRLGAIVKRPGAFEGLTRVKLAAFDKTGTLTLGEPRVSDARSLGRLPLGEALRLAAGLEAESRHPLARAIVGYYRSRWGEPPRPESVDEVPGMGVVGVVDGRSVAVGGERLLEAMGLEPPGDPGVEGTTILYIVVDGAIEAALGIDDAVREEAPEAIEMLRSMGVEVYILSGDSPRAVRRLAARLGVPEGHALGGLDPLEKAQKLRSLSSQVGPALYVGDGVNDAAVLAEASVGIAVREALDAAKQAGDIVLARSDLRIIPALIELSRKVVGTVKFNLFWAFAYNVVLIPAAAGLLAPIGVALTPELAALAMSLSSISVTANSSRLLAWRPSRRADRRRNRV